MASKMAVIYKITCNDLNVRECYFGSTINIKHRKSTHKFHCHNEKSKKYNYPLYQFIRNNGGWDNWEINIIDCITSDDKKIYEKCERKYIEENRDIVLNKEIPGRTINEYYEDNKEKISQYKEHWSKQKVTCPICLKIVTRVCLPKHQSRLTCQLNKCIIID